MCPIQLPGAGYHIVKWLKVTSAEWITFLKTSFRRRPNRVFYRCVAPNSLAPTARIVCSLPIGTTPRGAKIRERIAPAGAHVRNVDDRRGSRVKEKEIMSRGWQIGRFFGLSLAMHFGWELLQIPLFAGSTGGFWAHVWTCLVATATGDLLFMLAIYACVAISLRDAAWVASPRSYRHPATWVLPNVVGPLLAVTFELWAVHVDHRYEYGAMPIVPVLRVGWTPILQMIVIPTATLVLCGRGANRSLLQTAESAAQ